LEVDDIPTVELAMTYDDGSKKKVKVPTHDLEESVEQVLYCFHEFLEAARKLALDGNGNGSSSIAIPCADMLARLGTCCRQK
jgi:hypothetical protein